MPAHYGLTTVPVEPLDARRLAPHVGEARIARVEEAAARAREMLAGRRVINVNSTAKGGGVAEILPTLLGYVRHTGIDVQWLVVGGDDDFFGVTKRIHNGLYGQPGDQLELDGGARKIYEGVLSRSLRPLRDAIRAEDVVIVHDPQPAGLIPTLRELGATVVWRCHVGIDQANAWSDQAWSFVRPYVEGADAFVFSRESFAPPWVERSRLAVIAPSIDPFTAKNAELTPAEVLEILSGADFITYAGPRAPVRAAGIVCEGSRPSPSVPLVVQVSRWDRLKDMPGVLTGFVEGVSSATGAHLVLAGPVVDGVDDDPEAWEIWNETVELWEELAPADRARVHLAAIPMNDVTENARIVNALQRHAAIVVQKSLAEGFGLTVAEAMWKSRPVVASAVGGIADQIVDGESGLLHEPSDLPGFAERVTRLLTRPAEAELLAVNAHHRVVDAFLADRHLLQYAALLERLLTEGPLH